MSEFTEGPWHIKPGDCLNSFEVMHEHWYVATTHDGAGDGDSEANAKLIAAAPDLLEALESLFNAVDSSTELTPGVMKKAQAAIKKARGES